MLEGPAKVLAHSQTLDLIAKNGGGVGTWIARSSGDAISTNGGGIGRHALLN